MTSARPVSGQQFHLVAGRYTAQVGEVAAVLRAVHVQDEALTETWPDDQVAPMGAGIVLAPWPNRTAAATWRTGATTQKLDITEPARGNAIHGLLRNTAYRPVDVRPDRVELAASIYPQHGYPFALDTLVVYQLADDGLTVTHVVTNVGSAAAPFGVGAHPYLRVGDVPAGELTVTVRGRSRVFADDKQIPIRTEPVGPDGPDVRTGGRVGELDIDVSFTDLEVESGRVRHEVRAADGRATVLWADAVFAWAHVFTPKIFPGPGLPGQRSAVAVEPMTCPANALNSGQGLIHLDPGKTWSASWGIRAQGW